MAKFPKRNASGCADPTAYEALTPIVQEEAALEARTTSPTPHGVGGLKWLVFDFYTKLGGPTPHGVGQKCLVWSDGHRPPFPHTETAGTNVPAICCLLFSKNSSNGA